MSSDCGCKNCKKIREHVSSFLPFKILEAIADKPLRIAGVAMASGMSRNFNGSYVERCEFNKYSGSVPVVNGLLDLASLELNLFDPKIIYTYKLNVRFDPAAKCPKWVCFSRSSFAQRGSAIAPGV